MLIRLRPNGWELKCGDENFTNAHCFQLLSFEIAKLVKIHRLPAAGRSRGSVTFSDRLGASGYLTLCHI